MPCNDPIFLMIDVLTHLLTSNLSDFIMVVNSDFTRKHSEIVNNSPHFDLVYFRCSAAYKKNREHFSFFVLTVFLYLFDGVH